MDLNLRGKAVLVIGGGSGIGLASAAACTAEGASIMLADLDQERAELAAAELSETGGSAVAIAADATDEQSVAGAVHATVDQFGKLDVLIVSPGANPKQHQDWHFAVDIYLKGPFYACKYAVEEMLKTGGGSIITIGSIASVTGGRATSVGNSGYASAKHGVLGLTRTVALTYAAQNIRANTICPGYIKTGATRAMYETEDGGRKLIEETLRVPMGRWGEASEIGKVAAFLASDAASYITGQPIVVDGGFMAR